MNKLTQNEVIETLEIIAKEFNATITCLPKNNQLELHIEGEYIYSAIMSDIAQKIADNTGYDFYHSYSTKNSISGYIRFIKNNKTSNNKFESQRPHYQFKLKERITFSFNKAIKMMETPWLEYYLNEKKNSYLLILSNGDLSGEENKCKQYLEDTIKIKEIIQTKKYEGIEISEYTLNEIQEILNQIEKIQLHQNLNIELEKREDTVNHKL